MEQILIAIQQQLADNITELKYIDKDWNQLKMEQPPVKWPCVLIDIDRVDFITVKAGPQRAEADIAVTVANLRLVPSSSKVPNRFQSYDTIRLIGTIHRSLNGFDGNGAFRPLMRTAVHKLFGNNQAEIYAITYRTVFVDE
ncbi:MAG: hypothetical protein IJ057_10360 [Bacteroidales bacterium]|nr:hypothetical protein [Bacteroidales bacterium]